MKKAGKVKSKAKAKAKTKTMKPPKMAVFSAAAGEEPVAVSEDRIYASNLSLHELFAQQTTKMLDQADLTEEQKQSILIGMSCPCCGGGGFSFTAKLRR
jgi:3-oxoacyl-ACP reductase-like protein